MRQYVTRTFRAILSFINFVFGKKHLILPPDLNPLEIEGWMWGYRTDGQGKFDFDRKAFRKQLKREVKLWNEKKLLYLKSSARYLLLHYGIKISEPSLGHLDHLTVEGAKDGAAASAGFHLVSFLLFKKLLTEENLYEVRSYIAGGPGLEILRVGFSLRLFCAGIASADKAIALQLGMTANSNGQKTIQKSRLS